MPYLGNKSKLFAFDEVLNISQSTLNLQESKLKVAIKKGGCMKRESSRPIGWKERSCREGQNNPQTEGSRKRYKNWERQSQRRDPSSSTSRIM